MLERCINMGVKGLCYLIYPCKKIGSFLKRRDVLARLKEHISKSPAWPALISGAEFTASGIGPLGRRTSEGIMHRRKPLSNGGAAGRTVG